MKVGEKKDVGTQNTQLEGNTFNRLVTQGQETLSRIRIAVKENPTYIRFSERCAQLSNILYRTLAVCFYLGVNLGGMAILFGLLYTNIVLKQTYTWEGLLNAFWLNNFTVGR